MADELNGNDEGAKRRVLVVDDDRDFAEGLDIILTSKGYDVALAYNARQAKDVTDDFEPQVALVDIRLGSTSGIDCLSALQERSAGIVCIMVTAYAEIDTAVEALRHGAQNYLTKPLNTDELVATLENCFGNFRLEEEKRAAEKALRESQARFKGLVDNSPSAINLKDLDGRYRLINRRFEEWYGVSAAEMMGRTSHDVFPKRFADQYIALDRQVLETEEVCEREVDVPFSDGSLHRVDVVKFPVLDSVGQVIGVGSIITDVTARRRAEEQLREAQKIEAVGQLTGGVAHDFNNLLTVIMGNLELLSGNLRGDAKLHKHVEGARNATLRGAELTYRLLAFARNQPLDPKAINLNNWIGEMIDLLGRTLGETIEIETVYGEDLWNCLADPVQVQSAILNLALNARDAMADGGKLTIETANSYLDEDNVAAYVDVRPGHYVLLSVTDTGPGMAPETIEHAFEPFFTTKEAGRGSGLGLSMVYGFVKQSGGNVKIYSEIGHGTAVQIYLPKIEGEEEEAKKPEVGDLDEIGVGTILVVEDDIEVRTLALTLLGDLGYRVLEAQDGPSALAALDGDSNVDLLFTDVVLPGGMSGLDLAEQVTTKRPEIKVLYTSGYTESVMLREGKLTRDAALLRKPYRKSDLAQQIRKVLESRPPGAALQE